MQLGLSTYSFPWALSIDEPGSSRMTLTDLVQIAARHQIHRIQIGDNCPLHLLVPEERASLRRNAEASSVEFEVGTRRLDHENIKKYIQLAEEFSSPFLRVVIDDADFHPSVEEVIKTIHSFLPLLKEKNIVLALENHDRFPAKTLAEIIENTDTNYVGICLDTANSLGAGQGINEILPLLAPYTVNLHVKDFTIERVTHKMGFNINGCAAGDGMLSIPSLIQTIHQTGRCKTVTLEVWSDACSSPAETIQREAQWVEKSIRYLKTIIT